MRIEIGPATRVVRRQRVHKRGWRHSGAHVGRSSSGRPYRVSVRRSDEGGSEPASECIAKPRPSIRPDQIGTTRGQTEPANPSYPE